jgi:hypothetical protein
MRREPSLPGFPALSIERNLHSISPHAVEIAADLAGEKQT